MNLLSKIVIILSIIFLTGCVNSPDDLDNKNVIGMKFDFVELVKLNLLKKYDDDSGLYELILHVADKDFNAYGKFSLDNAKKLSNTKTINEITIKRTKEGDFLIKKLQVSLGLWGSLMYWLAFSWLSLFLPYTIALMLSYVVPILGSALMLLVGSFFIEY